MYLLRHKYFVFLECRKYGLYRLGFIHDISKFSRSEFFPYTEYYFGEQAGDADATGYREAWDVHKYGNKHHWQFWVRRDEHNRDVPLEMPRQYALEMICDWNGAGKAKRADCDTRSWYIKKMSRGGMVLHPATRQLIERELGIAESEEK